VTTLRARIHDPMGTRRFRALPLVVAFVLASAVAAVAFGGSIVPTLLAGLAALHLPLMFRPRRPPREATLRIGPGWVDVVSRLGRDRITAKDVLGASTARSGAGVSLSLTRKSRRLTTTTFVFADETEAKAIRDALGIGHDGFGGLLWRTRHSSLEGVGSLLAGVTAVALFGGMAIIAKHSDAAYFFAGIYTGLPVLLFSVLGWLARSGRVERAPCVALDAQGVWIYGARWTFSYYSNITHAEVAEDGIRVLVDAERGLEAMRVPTPLLSIEEREALVAQLMGAAARARGFVAPKPEADERLDVLRRRGERARDWFARLDALAMGQGGAGYRGTSIDKEDLHHVLDDPDADVELRVAAARILSRADATLRERALARAEATRDDDARERIRIAVENEDGAAIDELEAEADRAMLRAMRSPLG
jgi:hypothetical protein